MSYLFLFKDRLTWNIPLLIGVFIILFLYVFLLKKTTPEKTPYTHIGLFFSGLCLFSSIIGSPLSALSHLSFSLHMIQMGILYFIVPPLLLLGIPYDMYRLITRLISFKLIRNGLLWAKTFLYIFAVLLFIYHLPIVIQTLSKHVFFQNAYLIVLFVLTFGMWWPIVSPHPKQRLSGKTLKRYVFISGLVITPACLFFIMTAFLNSVENPFVSQVTAHLCLPSESNSFSLLPPPFNTQYDQFIAGTLMLLLHKLGLMMSVKLKAKFMKSH